MAVLSPQVRYEGVNGPSSFAIRGPSLTQLGHRADNRTGTDCMPFLTPRRPQSASLKGTSFPLPIHPD
jgi:hypothetical protein